jgi:hypothetical protein
MSQIDVYKCVERFKGKKTSVICTRSGWPVNVTCVEVKEMLREFFDEVVSVSSCAQIVARPIGISLEGRDSNKCRRLAETNKKMVYSFVNKERRYHISMIFLKISFRLISFITFWWHVKYNGSIYYTEKHTCVNGPPENIQGVLKETMERY